MKTFCKNFAFILGILSTSCFGMEYEAQDFFSGKLDHDQLEKLAQEKEKEIIAIINSSEFDVNQKITLYEHNYSTFIIAHHCGTPRILEALLQKAKPSEIDPSTIIPAFNELDVEAFSMLLKYKVNPLEILKGGGRHPIYFALRHEIYSQETVEKLKTCMNAIMQVRPEFLITPDAREKMDCWQAAQRARNESAEEYQKEKANPELAISAQQWILDRLHYTEIFIEYLEEQYAKYKYTPTNPTISEAFFTLNVKNFLILLKLDKKNPLDILKNNNTLHPIYHILRGVMNSAEDLKKLKKCMDAIMQVCPEFLITPDTYDKMNCWQAAQKARKALLEEYEIIPNKKSLEWLHYTDIFIEYLKEQYAKYKYTIKD